MRISDFGGRIDRRSQFKTTMVVGSGSFGRVFRVTHRLLGTEYVIKRSAHPFTTPSARRIWLQVRAGGRPLMHSDICLSHSTVGGM